MTDNGVSFRSLSSRKGVANAKNQAQTHPTYAPRTNGKAERFVQTSLLEWAYAKPYKPFIRTGRRTVAFPPRL
jgi:transposase InsO family protein